MDVSANQPAEAAAEDVQLGPPGVRRSLGQRRPSGQPPPLPHHLQPTGVGWLIAAVALATLSLLVFAGGLHGPAVDVTVVEDGVVRWLGGLRAPGLLPAMQGLAAAGSNVTVTGLLWALLLRRRLRHLLVVLVAWALQGIVVEVLLAPNMRRPRPFGVEFRTDWTAWAMPSEQTAIDVEGRFTSEASLVLGFTSRQALRQALEERSDGRLHLDPAGAR